MVKNPSADAGYAGSILGSGRSPGGRKWQPTLVFLPGKSHEQRRLQGYSPWGRKRVRHDLATKKNPKLDKPSPHTQTLQMWWIKSGILLTSFQFSHSVLPNSLQPHYCSTPGFPVHHQPPELTQTHVH